MKVKMEMEMEIGMKIEIEMEIGMKIEIEMEVKVEYRYRTQLSSHTSSLHCPAL